MTHPSAELPAHTDEEKDTGGPAPVGRRFITLYVIAYLGLYLAVMTPLLVSLAIRLEDIDPEGKTRSLGLVVGLGTLVSIGANLIVGVRSDRTFSRLGRRRPWMLGGMPVVLLGAVVTGTGSSVGVVLAGSVISHLGLSAIMTPLQAFLPDQVPEQQRGKVSGLLGFTAQVAGVVGYQLAEPLKASGLLLFLVPAAIACLTLIPVILFLPDPAVRREEPEEDDSQGVAAMFHSLTFDPRHHPDLGWTWAGRFLIQLSLMFLSTYQLYFLTDHLGYELDEVTGLLALTGGIGLLMTSAGAVVSGVLSDRLRRRKPFIYAAAASFAVGFVTVATASSFPQVLIGSQAILLGAGVFGAVDIALVTDVIPNRETEGAKYMSIFGIASALPSSVAPLIAPFVLAIGGGDNYTLLFLTAAGVAVVGGLTVRPIRGVR
ncbi:MFS transporter [Streptomyces europaeiscabiei]|uniref:MFS transporter n=1 Tax=Streptomyces europaeiscabiei TaxID=146819 RepID=A0AAJ2UHE7_9ACTN|nr:MFS transporter [Streptomyces europaeiscabiei]MDX3128368.1 MFS transporter [Streptomyces europaeiscabiei]